MYTIFIAFHGIEHKIEVAAANRNQAAQAARSKHPGYRVVSVMPKA